MTAAQRIGISEAYLYITYKSGGERIDKEQINWKDVKGEMLYIKKRKRPIVIDTKIIDEIRMKLGS